MDMQVLGDEGSFDYYGYVIRKRTGAGSEAAAATYQAPIEDTDDISLAGTDDESIGGDTHGLFPEDA